MTWSRSILVAALVLLTGCTASPPAPTPSVSTASTPASTPACAEASVSAEPSATAPPTETDAVGPPAAAPVDTTGWSPYVSGRYEFRIGHPPDWSVVPSERSWTMDGDAGVMDSAGQERFLSPDGDLWVTAWAAPFASEASLEGIQLWVRQYCVESLNTGCQAIGQRAVQLCDAERGCDAGLLVPFATDVQAFFTLGDGQQRIVVVAAWRAPDHPVAGLGTVRRVLEAFASTMDVWPPS